MNVGYAYVVGDIFHIGHLKHLKRCKKYCKKLIVGVLTDKATMEKKPKPIISFKERFEIIKELKVVDKVVKQDTYSPLSNILDIKPDILFESESHSLKDIKDTRDKLKGKVKVLVMPYYKGQSSTKIKQKIIYENSKK